MSNRNFDKFKKHIRDVPDFPKKGIIFKDITTLLKDPKVFSQVLNCFYKRYRDKKIDHVIAIESRGFIFGGVLANSLKAGFVPVRKKGKLPAATYKATYDLEHGTDTLEIHRDAIKPGDKVLIIDDLLATGGTVKAVTGLIKKLKGRIVEVAFLIELGFLNGRKRLKGQRVFSMIKY